MKKSRVLAVCVRNEGFTLLEVLLAAAITLMVMTVVSSILFSAFAYERTLRKQTDKYESLRLAASLLMQDGRFSSGCTGSGTAITFVTNTSGNYIVYQFADQNDNPDPSNLHRIVFQGGSPVNDDIVGTNFVSDPGAGDITDFTCTSGTRRSVIGHLVTYPVNASGSYIAIEVMAAFRA